MRRLVCGFALGALLGFPVAALAQSTGIAGVVRDSSGGVLPGVTVEAASPALIEGSRTALTDSQGRYNIVDLRPGFYTVTFTLPGFSTVKREEIQLSAQFVATVNAELKVGALEETVTVTGESPIVDTSNVVKRQIVDREVIESMPTSKNWSTLGVMTVGVYSNQNDVGGSAGEHQNQLKAHGGSFNDRIVQLDGLMIANMACNYACTGISTNDGSTQELSYEFGAISAEVGGGGVRVNIIPREGGNRFSGTSFFNFANASLQGNNVDDAMRAQNVLTADSIEQIYDASFAIGGPLKKDKIWFWTAHRFWGYEQIRTNTFYEKNPFDFVFDPDPGRPGTETQENGSLDLRLTWQISPRNKISGYYNYAPRNTNHWTLVSTIQPDASNLQNLPVNHFETVTFRSTISSKLLFEAAAGNMTEIWTREPVEDSETSTGYPVTEQTTGINFRAYSATFSRNYTSLRSYRTSLTYVTGSHAFKVGMTLQEGPAITDVYTSKDTALIVRNGAPFQVTVRTTPYTARERLVADLGIYAQDTWKFDRLTANLGIRFDYLNGKVDKQTAAGGTWIGPRSFEELTSVPNYKDIGPRLGVAYDLFGNGKTALKATVSRYILPYTLAVTRLLNPFNTSVNTATRPWTDNGDGIPQASELGALSNNAFGQVNVATRYDDPTIRGFGKRRGNWEYAASVTQEVMPRLSVDAGYYRRVQNNFTATDNLDVAPTDFEPYCVTSPRDSRLPGGGGQQICGLYDIVPTKFGVATNNIVRRVADLGVEQHEVFDGVDVTFAARPGGGVFLNGGVATGRIHFDQCQAYVDNPATTYGLTGSTFAQCDYSSGLLTQFKVNGTYTLPWQDIQIGGVLQNLPGQQILAQWNITQADVQNLGRPLSGGANTSRVVPLIEPGTEFTPRRTQIDLRLSKSFNLGGAKRLQLMTDIFNLTNSNAAVGATSNAGEPPASLITTYGSAWLRPLNVLQARYVKFGAQFVF
jgi:hypothetical protein